MNLLQDHLQPGARPTIRAAGKKRNKHREDEKEGHNVACSPPFSSSSAAILFCAEVAKKLDNVLFVPPKGPPFPKRKRDLRLLAAPEKKTERLLLDRGRARAAKNALTFPPLAVCRSLAVDVLVHAVMKNGAVTRYLYRITVSREVLIEDDRLRTQRAGKFCSSPKSDHTGLSCTFLRVVFWCKHSKGKERQGERSERGAKIPNPPFFLLGCGICGGDWGGCLTTAVQNGREERKQPPEKTGTRPFDKSEARGNAPFSPLCAYIRPFAVFFLPNEKAHNDSRAGQIWCCSCICTKTTARAFPGKKRLLDFAAAKKHLAHSPIHAHKTWFRPGLLYSCAP